MIVVDHNTLLVGERVERADDGALHVHAEVAAQPRPRVAAPTARG